MADTVSGRAWAKGWRRGMYGDAKEDGQAVAEPCPFQDGDSLKKAWDLGHIQGAKARNLMSLPEKDRQKAIRRELGR